MPDESGPSCLPEDLQCESRRNFGSLSLRRGFEMVKGISIFQEQKCSRFPDRLTVGQCPLKALILVRFQVGEPFFYLKEG